MSKIIVQKFGGSSLASPEQIKKIAAQIAQQHKAGLQVIAVVSAMGKTTDNLLKLAHEVSAVPNRRELDMLLSTGERISMALLSMALHDLNCPSISFTGSQAGVMTDGSHSNAVIQSIKPIRVHEALAQNKVVVLAGFQGVDPVTKEITTLGRGGSDTTAVTMAAHFKAERCEILKDVDGVYSADPRIVPNARLIKRVNGNALMEMCRWGAKVLHYRSVEAAVRDQVPLAIGRSDNFNIGTQVDYKNGKSDLRILAVNSIAEVHQLKSSGSTPEEAIKNFHAELDKNKLPYPEILNAERSIVSTDLKITYSSDIDTLNAIKKTFQKSKHIQVQQTHLSSVTVTASSVYNASSVDALKKLLKSNNILCESFLITPLSVSFFISQDSRLKAIQILHEKV